jgi:trans-2,3-dihydro-3-hydroxyanthranilate isomerase
VFLGGVALFTAASDQVAEPAGEQEQAPIGDQIAVEDPGEIRLAEVEVALDRGQRDVDDRRIDDAHQLPEADDDERDHRDGGDVRTESVTAIGIIISLHPYLVLDVFTDVPLRGNPLAVFTDAQGIGSDLMQRAARELNLSETVFLLPSLEGDADARARIFTPVTELPFAGHPVLGSAFALGERLGLSRVRLSTGAGVIPITLSREAGEIVFGEMEQPIPTVEPFERGRELLQALGLAASGLPIEAYRNGPRHVYVELAGEDEVAAVRPDLAAVSDLGALAVSCFAGSGPRFKTRMFSPALGVAEDPATGSAAGPLAVHLARHGRIGFGDRIEIRQGAEIGRPSVLHACAEGSARRIERVTVGGAAVIVARGEYRLE